MYVMELHGKSAAVRKSRPSASFALPTGKIGLEFEFESTGDFSWESRHAMALAPYFTSHIDGSLRGGTEFVLREPLFGEELLDSIRAMEGVSRALRFKSSYRTSMHVHLDMERATYPGQVLAVAVLYAIAEPFMYKFVGQARDMCNYCLPWYRHDQHFSIFLKGIKETLNGAPPAIVTKLKHLKEYKYSGLNFFSLGDYGTLEFRQAPVGMDASKVVEWINIIQSLKKFALGFGRPFDAILGLAYSQDYAGFLEQVFQEHYRPLIRLTPRPNEAYHLGLKTAASFVASANLLGFN